MEHRVDHNERQIEFIFAKGEAVKLVHKKIRDDPAVITWSCESWAEWLLTELDADRVEVSEDGENGAVVARGTGGN